MLNLDGFFFHFPASLSTYLLVMLTSIAIPAVIMMEVFFGIFSLIVPIMGRSGTELPPDLAIAVISCLFVCLYSQYLVSLIDAINHLLFAMTFIMWLAMSWYIMTNFGDQAYMYVDNLEQIIFFLKTNIDTVNTNLTNFYHFLFKHK